MNTPYKYGDRVKTLRDLEFHGDIVVAAGSELIVDHAMADGYYAVDSVPTLSIFRYQIHESDLELVQAFAPKAGG